MRGSMEWSMEWELEKRVSDRFAEERDERVRRGSGLGRALGKRSEPVETETESGRVLSSTSVRRRVRGLRIDLDLYEGAEMGEWRVSLIVIIIIRHNAGKRLGQGVVIRVLVLGLGSVFS